MILQLHVRQAESKDLLQKNLHNIDGLVVGIFSGKESDVCFHSSDHVNTGVSQLVRVSGAVISAMERLRLTHCNLSLGIAAPRGESASAGPKGSAPAGSCETAVSTEAAAVLHL